MIHRFAPFDRIVQTLACLALVASSSTRLPAQSDSTLHATHVLGFERIPNNTNGDLSIEKGALRFQKGEGPSAQISISSIQEISLGEQDKQTGGVPMAIGRTAVPYGGGRVVALFSHKKYDTLTVEYLDVSGAFHGAIFQLNKGQGQALKNELIAEGAPSTPEAKNENK